MTDLKFDWKRYLVDFRYNLSIARIEVALKLIKKTIAL